MTSTHRKTCQHQNVLAVRFNQKKETNTFKKNKIKITNTHKDKVFKNSSPPNQRNMRMDEASHCLYSIKITRNMSIITDKIATDYCCLHYWLHNSCAHPLPLIQIHCFEQSNQPRHVVQKTGHSSVAENTCSIDQAHQVY